jgi:acyl-coenzyme A synthetase/AMP-(fatty) acid ligase
MEDPPGELGRLHVRGPVGTIFWGGPAAAAEVAGRQRDTVHEGWVRIGDWVIRDDEGYLFFVARDEDLIERGGRRIGPGALEDALVMHAAVEAAGVYRRSPSEVVALVVARPGVPLDGLEAELRRLVVDRYGSPAFLDTVRFVDGLPRTPFGTMPRRAQWEAWLAGQTAGATP